ncbi:HlyD family secretion protein [Aureimonas pseudogalii]|uniref:HlyD family secretion protein n=1 Tax=Aureimonas pseudogalii TaxID=1744844 RepID=A0A7W6H990_9HYPH|nr:HlyD family secretion protein [Aureimonas pseudogalii]
MIVHELAVHTAGAVIAPGEAVMLIVPAADKLEAEIRIAPQDIDQLTIGQDVRLRFSAFDQGTTPEVTGTIERIGADLTHEPQTGLSYYTVRAAIGADEAARLGAVKLVPGMPVEAFVKTGDRTALSYVIKPLRDQFERAFREG